MKTKVKTWVNALIGAVLGLLGFGTTSCYEKYGSPYGDFIFDAQVTDEEEMPLESAQVVLRGGWSENGWMGGGDTIYTDAKGKIHKEFIVDPAFSHIKVVANDTTGEHQSDSIVTEIQYKGKKGWYSGKATLNVQLTLKKN